MKKIICSLTFGFLALSVIMGFTGSIANAEFDMRNKTTIYVNGIKISSEDTSKVTGQEMAFPLQAILEALGAEIIENKENNDIEIKYLNKTYLCEFHSTGDSYNYITSKDALSGRYMRLISNGVGGSIIEGAYIIINDKVYLTLDTGKCLFGALGCNVEIDLEQRKLSITYDSNKVKIYVNDIEVYSEETRLLIPLQIVLEALSAKVVFEESTGSIYFNYEEVEYICRFVALNQNFPNQKSILVCKVENKDSINNDDYIQLNPMSGNGSYEVKNNVIYLYEDTGKRLFEALGCEVDIDLKQKILRINSGTAQDKPSDWAVEEVEESEDLGLVSESMKTKYQLQITRLEFCKLAVLLLEKKGALTSKESYLGENPYNDTGDRAVLLASRLGIVNGKENHKFDPDGYITRQEAATMLYRTAKVLKYEIMIKIKEKTFADEPQISNWAKEAVSYVSAVKDKRNDKEIMGGIGNDLFSPYSHYTRQQAYITMKRLYNAG